MKDYIANGIPCAFFNFKGYHALECKVRMGLKDILKVTMSPVEANQVIIDFFKVNKIENVIWVASTHLCFWRI